MYNLIGDPHIGIYAQKILINLLNAEKPDFVKIHWLPSKKEIKDLLKLDNKISLEVKFQIGGTLTSKSFTVSHICKVSQLMEQIYNLPQMSQLTDKYAFWLYLSSETVKSTEDKALFQESL